jgi:exopolysaccharide production protein ExoZ
VVYGAIGVEMRHGALAPAFLQRLGDSSYSLYLVHVPALTTLRTALDQVVPTTPLVHAITLAIVPVYVIVVARLCYRFAESPLQRFFHRVSTRRGTAPSAASRRRPRLAQRFAKSRRESSSNC